MSEQPGDRRRLTSPLNGKRGGRPAKTECSCGSPGGKHRYPCPIYQSERRELREAMRELERVADEQRMSVAAAIRIAIESLKSIK